MTTASFDRRTREVQNAEPGVPCTVPKHLLWTGSQDRTVQVEYSELSPASMQVPRSVRTAGMCAAAVHPFAVHLKMTAWPCSGENSMAAKATHCKHKKHHHRLHFLACRHPTSVFVWS
jgi:hypothetical protein